MVHTGSLSVLRSGREKIKFPLHDKQDELRGGASKVRVGLIVLENYNRNNSIHEKYLNSLSRLDHSL